MHITFAKYIDWHLLPTIKLSIDSDIYYYKSISFVFLRHSIEFSWNYQDTQDDLDEYYDDIV